MDWHIGTHLMVSTKSTRRTPKDVTTVPLSSQASMPTKEHVGTSLPLVLLWDPQQIRKLCFSYFKLELCFHCKSWHCCQRKYLKEAADVVVWLQLLVGGVTWRSWATAWFSGFVVGCPGRTSCKTPSTSETPKSGETKSSTLTAHIISRAV